MPDPAIATLTMQFASATLDDIEAVRIATKNRARSAAESGLPISQYEDQITAFQAIEHRAALDLQRAMRQHHLGPWVARTTGIGEKQGARLIAAIGDPAWNAKDDRPRRGPAELWAYCGYDPGQRRRKGVKDNWNSTAKMRAFLCAEACMKCRQSPYRAVYDAQRVKYAEATHDGPCPRCGPSGKPALPGSPLSDGHKHARALRKVAKAILRDLWREAERLRLAGLPDELDRDQKMPDSHQGGVPVNPLADGQELRDAHLPSAVRKPLPARRALEPESTLVPGA